MDWGQDPGSFVNGSAICDKTRPPSMGYEWAALVKRKVPLPLHAGFKR